MRIPLICIQCQGGKFFPAELQQDRMYLVECDEGHKSYVWLDMQKFELLFQLGIHAIVDGYYREAVTSFAAALEDFYEFYCRVGYAKSNSDFEGFDKAWKVLQLSERKFGAYAHTYLIETGTPAPVLSNDEISYRNKVVHQGAVPDMKRAIGFGDSVLNIIYPILSELKEKYPVAVGRVASTDLIGRKELSTEHLSVQVFETRISVKVTRPHTGGVAEAVETIRHARSKATAWGLAISPN